MRNTLILLTLSVILVIGLIGGELTKTDISSPRNTVFAANISPSPSPSPTNPVINSAFNSKATDLRLSLNSLLKEHAALGGITLTALYSDATTATRLMQLMTDNGNQIASLIQTEYGKNAHDTFIKLWTQHMNEYQNYTLARKANNLIKMNAAKKNLTTIASDFGMLFDVSSKNILPLNAKTLMQEHINGTLAYIDAMHSQSSSAAANLLKQNYDQAGKFADYLSKGMILDNPNLYK